MIKEDELRDRIKAAECPSPHSWEAMIKLEPRLIEVERLTRSLPTDRNWRDWETIKAAFSLLVGATAIQPGLRTVEYYDVAYDFLLGVFERGQS